MHGTGTVRETYHAAIQHDIVDLPENAHLAGVVRRPTGWFRSTVDENYRALGPPEELLTETKDRQETLQQRGMCAEEAHNAAWEETGFEARYRDYVASSADADRALDDLVDRVKQGETVVLICFEGESKRCHRHALVDELENRLA